MYRLAVIASHPIQYQAPWFQALAKDVDLDVFYCQRQTAELQRDAGFAEAFEWDVPLLEGYRFHWLTNVSKHPGVERFAGCDTPDIASVLCDGRFDACIVNGWYLKSYLQAIRACWRWEIPVLMRGDSHLRTPRRRMVQWAKYLPYRGLLSRIDAHLCVGRANQQYLCHYGVSRSRLFFAPHFVDNQRFAAGAARAVADGSAAALRAHAGASPETTVFAFVGKLVEHKRPGDFVNALAHLHRRGANVRGLVVGSGSLAEPLKRHAVEMGAPVTFAGFKNQRALPACYAASDCVVLPSTSETWGLVVNEAMACGRPAIVSHTVGCRDDLIDDSYTGISFRMGDIDALTTAMDGMMRSLRTHHEARAAAIAERIACYDCRAAVAGTLQAVEFVTETRADTTHALTLPTPVDR